MLYNFRNKIKNINCRKVQSYRESVGKTNNERAL